MSIETLPQIRGAYRQNAKLANTTWFGVGGNAEILLRPHDLDDLAFFLQHKPLNLDINILGLGSNVIIRDGGVKGVVIKLGKNFTNVVINKDIVTVGCACTSYNLVHFLLENNLSGLEFLVGVPGSIGGAVAMNSGCYNDEISNHLISVVAIEKKTGNIHEFSIKELGLKYRHNDMAEEFIFTHACFKLKSERDSNSIKSKIDEITKARQASQPIKEKTGGSTFKNPLNLKAWQLIDNAGFRGFKLGGAAVSELHCNFLINTGNATATDLEMLGNMIQEKVEKSSGVKLEWEIKRIGISSPELMHS